MRRMGDHTRVVRARSTQRIENTMRKDSQGAATGAHTRDIGAERARPSRPVRGNIKVDFKKKRKRSVSQLSALLRCTYRRPRLLLGGR